IPRSKKGRGAKKILARPVPITPALASKLRLAAAGRSPTDALLTRADGRPWQQSDHTRPFLRAAAAVGLDRTVTIYALRHSSIVRQLLAGVPVRIVAVAHDTSVSMIERTYSAHIGDHADAIARRGLLEAPPLATVVPIRGASA